MKRILLWGTGQVAETLWAQCQTLSQYELLGFIDNNTEKQGSIFKNLPIYPPEILKSIQTFDQII
jgi:FlaA1/EpsC-like NDP-sugar epimerase